MGEEDLSFPSIDPSFFDLIVVGTGLPESVIAAASSAAGKTVLHLDPNSFYGSHFSSLPLEDFVSFLQSHSSVTHSPPSSSFASDYVALHLKPRSLYSHVEVYCPAGSLPDLPPSRNFSLDISGPRVFFCADSAVDLMLKSGASHHIEFKSIDASFIYSSSDGKLSSVPDSRSAIFKDRHLTLTEKNQLMRFFKLVQEHFQLATTASEEHGRILDEDLDSPFVDFLNKHRLPPKIKSIILYAIAMADYDQDSPELSKNMVKTKDGIDSLALYHSSVGRFTNALGALIYPIYGQGELPQAFCRCAAVKGALYVLRMPVTALLVEKESNVYKGVKLKSGQEIFSHQLVMGPSFIVPPLSLLSSNPELRQESYENSCLGKVKGQIARGVCITRGSINADVSNLLVIFPPRSLHSEQVAAVRALQLSSSLTVCPSGLFVLYLSTLCEEASQGKESLRAAMNTLLTHPFPKMDENTVSTQSESAEGQARPTLLWSIMYIQELPEDLSEAISSCPMPDGNLDYRNTIESTRKLFHKIYPDEEFFPMKEAVEDTD